MAPQRRAAWHGYLAIIAGLAPTMRDMSAADDQVALELAALSTHLAEHAGLWGDEGPRLIAIADRAQAMHRAGDRTGSMVLVRALAHRLFVMSSPSPASSQGRDEDRPHPPGAAV